MTAQTIDPAADPAAAGAFSDLEPIGLDELIATADLQIRRDRKYLVPEGDLPTIVSALDPGHRVLTIGDRVQFAYRSTYFDTPGLDAYLDAAHRRPSRFKVRTRSYLDTARCMLEVKTRDRRGRTVKQRVACDPQEEVGLTAAGRAFVGAIQQTTGVANALRPTLTTAYFRATLLLGGREPARVTIDTAVVWHDPAGQARSLGPMALIETKTAGRPSSFDRILWRAGHRPATISKYCTGLAALDPTLPANKWNRTLRTHLDWQPAMRR